MRGLIFFSFNSSKIRAFISFQEHKKNFCISKPFPRYSIFCGSTSFFGNENAALMLLQICSCSTGKQQLKQKSFLF